MAPTVLHNPIGQERQPVMKDVKRVVAKGWPDSCRNVPSVSMRTEPVARGFALGDGDLIAERAAESRGRG